MDKPDSRTRLLETAMDLIWRQSYGAVSVDVICKGAGVFKGTFYHFFPSKADLVAAALEHYWEGNRPNFERIFSPPAAPLEQIRNYFLFSERRQLERRRKYGRIVGCPYTSIGSEIGQQEETVGEKLRELIGHYCGYFERALREANREGSANARDPKAKSRQLFALLEGTLTQARILNDPAVMKGMADRAVEMIAAASRENAA